MAASALLKTQPELTGIVAASDNVAMGTLKAAAELELNVPQQLSVIGFDNLHGVEHLSTPLTTMDIDKEYLGLAGVRLLYDSSPFSERPCVNVLIRPKLVVRSSVSSPPNLKEDP